LLQKMTFEMGRVSGSIKMCRAFLRPRVEQEGRGKREEGDEFRNCAFFTRPPSLEYEHDWIWYRCSDVICWAEE
jgi:hypothetical protein